MTNLLAIATLVTNCFCPLAPTGYNCYVDAVARGSNAQAFRYVAHPDYFEIIHPAKTNREYEVQWKRSLRDTQWLAYTRLTLTNDCILTTHILTRCPSGFFRVSWSPSQTP